MQIPLNTIKPSPYSPKKPFTDTEKEKLRNSLKTFGFAGSMIVCPDFQDEGKGFICLDGNSRLELLHELDYKKVDAKVLDIQDMKTLKKFIIAYDHTKKQYKNDQIKKDIAEIGEDILNLIVFDPGKYDLKEVETPQLYDTIDKVQFFISLPAESVAKARKRFTANAGKNGEKFDKIMDKMTDQDIVRSVLLYEFEI